MTRIGVIGIVITGGREHAAEVQEILTEFGDMIVGRMGVPDRINNVNCISVIVEGANERISALTGKLGRIDDVNVKSALTSVEIN